MLLDQRYDVLCGLVEFVEVVAFRCRFLYAVLARYQRRGRVEGKWGAYENSGLVGLHFDSVPDHGVPDAIQVGGLIDVRNCKQRAVPPAHTVRLLVAEDEVLEDIIFIWHPIPVAVAAAISLLVCLGLGLGRGLARAIPLTTLLRRRRNMDLYQCQLSSAPLIIRESRNSLRNSA